jgi:peptidyl-tRNA hydrolase
VAVRADLSAGQQLAQSVHAAFEFAVEYPTMTEVWRRHSNFLVVVGVRDEDVLLELANSAAAFDIRHTVVREPDYGNTVTAVALEPTLKASALCAEYPLALKGVKGMAMT